MVIKTLHISNTTIPAIPIIIAMTILVLHPTNNHYIP